MKPALFSARLQGAVEPLLVRALKPINLVGVLSKLPSKVNFILVQKLLNRAFAEQIAEEEFGFLTGRKLQIEIIDASLFVLLSYAEQQIICLHLGNKPVTAEVTLSVNSLDAISLIQQQVDPDTLFFQRKLKINGDTDLAHHVKNTIDTLNPELIPKLLLKLISVYKQNILLPKKERD